MTHIATAILHYGDLLREAGIPEKHVQALSNATATIIDNNLVTKHDIFLVHKDIALVFKEIELVRKDIKWIMIGGSILGTIILAFLATILSILIK